MPTPREMMDAARREGRDDATRSAMAGRGQRSNPKHTSGGADQGRESRGYGERYTDRASSRAHTPDRRQSPRRDARDDAQDRRIADNSDRTDARSSTASRNPPSQARGRRSSYRNPNENPNRPKDRDSGRTPSRTARHAASDRTTARTTRQDDATLQTARNRSPETPHRPQAGPLREQITRWRMYGITACAVIMLLGGFIGLLFFVRPTTSAVEMRNLTQYPEFTMESFLSGSYFTDVSLWYADTYPLREPMVAADHGIDSMFGVNTGSGMVGGNVQVDDIPVAQETQPSFEPVVPPAAAPDERAVDADIQANIMSGVYVTNGAGYSIYYFSQNAADTYITAMNTAAEKLYGTSTVYSIMAPANSITLSDEEALSVGGSDQQQALDYLSSRFDTRVKAVDLVSTIKEHRDEYLYFHTDHHWTQLGAYYGYVAFCKQKGVEPKSLSDWRSIDLGEFRGTYSETVESMGYTPSDNVEAYIPASTNETTYWTAYGEEVTGSVVDEKAADWEPSYKYSAFIAGDQPLEVIHNPKLSDGSSCLVVKDSYGCAFVPCLVDQYETVHVIDFRETDKNICDYAKENQIQDVIFMTGMKIGLTDSVAQTLLAEVS